MLESAPADPQRRLVAYLRVSTLIQRDGYGLPSQEREIRSWADRNGARIVATFVDVGVSGALDAVDRPQLSAALRLISDRGGDGLIVARLDRLARALTVQEAILASAWNLGASVYTADTGLVSRDDPSDPMRTALRQMMGVFSQLERAMIRQRLRQARIAKKALGLHGEGGYQFGWDKAGENEREQRIIRAARRQRRQGATWREIAERLNQRGPHYAPRAGVWSAARAFRMLRPRESPPDKARRWAANPPPMRTRADRAQRRTPPPPGMIGSGEAAQVLGVTPGVLRSRVEKGLVPCVVDTVGVHYYDPVVLTDIARRQRIFDEQWTRTTNATGLFGVSEQTVRRWALEGRIPFTVNLDGEYVVPNEAILNVSYDRIVLLDAHQSTRPVSYHVVATFPKLEGYACQIASASGCHTGKSSRFSGSALRLARQHAGLTQAELARRLGVCSAARIVQWETEMETPRPHQLPELARLLSISVPELFERKGSGDGLRLLRISAGMTLARAAAEIGLSTSAYHRLEHGRSIRTLDPFTADRLADTFGVTRDQLEQLVTVSAPS